MRARKNGTTLVTHTTPPSLPCPARDSVCRLWVGRGRNCSCAWDTGTTACGLRPAAVSGPLKSEMLAPGSRALARACAFRGSTSLWDLGLGEGSFLVRGAEVISFYRRPSCFDS